MSKPPRRSSREIDALLADGQRVIADLVRQAQDSSVDPGLLTQHLTALQQTFEKLIEDRKYVVQNERLARLYTVSRLINSSLDLQTVLEQVMDAIIELTGAERGFLMLLEAGQLQVRVGRNFDHESLAQEGFAVSRTVTNRVVETGLAVITTNAQEDTRFAEQESVINYALTSIMASPLRIREQVIGVIYVDNRAFAGMFSADDLQLLDMFGEQAAIAIDNAVQVREREEALKAQIAELQIEIDEVKKQRQVSEIVDTQYFQDLRGKVRQLRDRMRRRGDNPE